MLIQVGWIGFLLLAAVCIGYGLFIEKRGRARLACISIGAMSVAVAGFLDFIYQAWVVPW